MRRTWTTIEISTLRQMRRNGAPREVIARTLGRSLPSIDNALSKHAERRPRLKVTDDVLQRVGVLHAKGLTDTEIAEDLACERHTVGDMRRRLQLEPNTWSAHRRRRVAAKTREQLAAAGLDSLAELRVKAHQDFAEASGWPKDLRKRHTEIMNALWDRGPMTRREIADAVGMPWKGSRKSLVSNDQEGSYLAHLIKRGLVVVLKRAVKGKGRGRSVNIYSLPLWTERKIG